jgi:hypothetical protein
MAMSMHSLNILKAAVAGVVLTAAASANSAEPPAEPFKQTNIHFETNASACDMGIQISFDTDGITEGSVENSFEQEVFALRAVTGLESTHDITEMFQERVEPPITDLIDALGCEPSEDAISLNELLSNWPAGVYEFDGESDGTEFEGVATLTHRVPAGPEILAPEDGDVVPHDQNLLIRWNKVTGPILPFLGPVEIVGYHVVVVDITNPTLAPGKTKTAFDADLAKGETSLLVPKQYLEPKRIYEFEVLATEKGGNQTITEGGIFCTRPRTEANCEEP